MTASLRRRLEEVTKDLWLSLSMLLIAGLLNLAITSNRMVLVFYMLPTVGAGYLYGRRQATLTAVGSALVVALLGLFKPALFTEGPRLSGMPGLWVDFALWAGVLVVTGYIVGSLYEHKNEQIRELRKTYYGVLELLRHFISNDKYTEHHSYRVAFYAVRIAEQLGMDTEDVEDVHAASLLHDIGKLDISREILYKAARLTEGEFEQMRTHVDRGARLMDPVGGSLRRVLPMVLAHHERVDGSGYHALEGDGIPLGARVIAVADVYDSLTSDRPYRKAMSPFEAKTTITNGSGTEFDPQVVDAFLTAFRKGALEAPAIVV